MSARDANSAARRSPHRRSRCCGAGWPNDEADPRIRCSRPAAVGRSVVTRSRCSVTNHAITARQRCPSIDAKTITPHVLRHSTAMTLLHAGVDTSVIALWLGHENIETIQIYLHADMAMKENALARTTPTGTRPADTSHPTTT